MSATSLGLDGWLERIEHLHHRAIDLSLDRVRVVAGRLGIGFDCPVFIVGGTNGKGSTCAMLESILRAAGYRTALYTSPHLLRFNERARIAGDAAGDQALIEQFEAVERSRGDTSLTYFEFTTLAILRLFMAARPDAVVLEVGLGGRLDATNIVDADCAVVTSIDLDHMDYLGPTREHIGFEKAHICRAGRPAVCADPRPPQRLLEVARQLGADLWLLGRDFGYQGDRQQWAYAGRRLRRAGLPYPSLRGANQLLNAAGSLAALEALGQRLPVSQQAVRHGLLNVELAGRFQVLPGRPAVILDVAHNPHSAAVLAANLDNMGFYPRTLAVLGMLRDKDAGGVVDKLAGRIDHWYVGGTTGPRGLSGTALAETVRGRHPAATVDAYDDVTAAFDAAHRAAAADDRIVTFGSFLTVAEVMRALRRRVAEPR
ncbi:MAG: bifunctional tetrahydrofolate synthase/dihydrofolate synthase [Burkholderiales bacterium]|nr:bifunctional tetrahydrofolate synthase/dihydrofolate synthase [Burkholderiales bacterium]